jgi:predicted  nucleic acid-binding Zn-ribbon protein
LIKNIIRQNKKGALQEFLFGSQLNHSINHSDSQNDLQEKIQILQNQLNSLQQKVINLETKVENPKYALKGQNKASEAIKSIQQ